MGSWGGGWGGAGRDLLLLSGTNHWSVECQAGIFLRVGLVSVLVIDTSMSARAAPHWSAPRAHSQASNLVVLELGLDESLTCPPALHS